MSRFEIQQYELHIATYQIEAQSPAAAIKRLFDGNGEMLDGPEFAEIVEDKGMPSDEHPQLVRDLRRLGVEIKASIVPSIRSIRGVKDAHEEGAK